MKHITIIAPDGQTNLSTVACIAGAYEIFTRANEYFKESGSKESGSKEFFKIEIAGITQHTDLAGGLT